MTYGAAGDVQRQSGFLTGLNSIADRSTATLVPLAILVATLSLWSVAKSTIMIVYSTLQIQPALTAIAR
jgi:hypothetical protein